MTLVFKVVGNATPVSISLTGSPTALEAINAASISMMPNVSAPVDVTVTPVSISLGTIPPVCPASTSAPLSYTLPVSPQANEYSIDFTDPAIMDVAYTMLPTSPITLTLPGTLSPGTYTGTLNVRLSGNCESAGYSFMFTVNPDNTVSAVSSSPTLCINSVLTNIMHATTGASGISNDGVVGANGLPAGVSASWASNAITISGTPTVAGTFN